MSKSLSYILLYLFFNYCNSYGQSSSIYDEKGPMSEILCDNESAWDIFTCRIIENYRTGNVIFHRAVIEEKYRGAPADTITLSVIRLGCTLGSINMVKMIPDSRHLIFGVKQADGSYLTRYGWRWHSGILNVSVNEKYRPIEERSKKYLKTIRKYFELVNSNHNGQVTISVDNHFSAAGFLEEGLPHGKWLHQELNNDGDLLYEKIIHYKNGILHGEKYKQVYNEGEFRIGQINTFESGECIKSVTFPSKHYSEKVTTEESVRNTDSLEYTSKIVYDSTGRKIYHSNNIKHSSLYFKVGNGKYSARFPSSHVGYRKTLSEGNYYRGAKVGQWSYYSPNGQVDSIVTYSRPKPSDYNFVLYYPNGDIAIEGNMIDGVEQGVWKTYNELGELVDNMTFNDGLYSGIHNRSPRYTMTYKNSKTNGPSTSYFNNGKLRSLINYKDGRYHGSVKEYYKSGQLKQESSYKDGHLIGEDRHFNIEGQLVNVVHYDMRGSKSGYQKHYNADLKLIEEGAYINGYKTGTWINYKRYEEGLKNEYPTDLNELMTYDHSLKNRVRISQYNPELHSR